MDTVAAVCGSVCEHVPPVRVVVFQRNVMNNFSVSSTTLTPIFTRARIDSVCDEVAPHHILE